MTFLYLGLGVANLKNLRNSINLIINFQIESMRDNPNDVMINSLKLKQFMLR